MSPQEIDFSKISHEDSEREGRVSAVGDEIFAKVRKECPALVFTPPLHVTTAYSAAGNRTGRRGGGTLDNVGVVG